jgi:hypothetical protein
LIKSSSKKKQYNFKTKKKENILWLHVSINDFNVAIQDFFKQYSNKLKQKGYINKELFIFIKYPESMTELNEFCFSSHCNAIVSLGNKDCKEMVKDFVVGKKH